MSDISFPVAGIHRMANMENWHFWHVGRRLLIQQLLDQYLPSHSTPIYDLGCGTGYMVQYLQSLNYNIAGIDYYLDGLLESDAPKLIQANIHDLPLARQSLDAIMLLDVLEHTDDLHLLQAIRPYLKPNGLLFISVPAFPFLWSYRDDAAGHLRRYTKSSLEDVLHETNYKIHTIEYYQFTGMPLLFVTRLLGRDSAMMRDREDKPSPIVNAVMKRINTLEVNMRKFIKFPWGTSLVAVASFDNE